MSIIEVTEANFDELIDSHQLVAIEFTASWCQPCKQFAQHFLTVSKQFPSVLFASVDVEKQKQLAEDFSVRSVPFLMILKQRTAIYAESGNLPESALVDLIKQAEKADVHAAD